MSIDWKDIAADMAKVAPLLGTLIGGPAAPVVGAMIASVFGVPNEPAAIQQALATNPDAVIKLRQVEADEAVKLRELAVTAENNRLTAETAAIQSVNATMQVEAKADHWPTYSWRPFCGFVFGAMFFGTYFVLPLCKLPVPAVPFEAWAAMGAVLGVASWYRGKMQASPEIPSDNRG